METSSGLVAFASALFFLAQLCGNVQGLKFTMDVENKIDNRMFKVRNFEYLQEGSELRKQYSKFLPDDFEYGKFDSTKGVWALFPEESMDCSKDIWNFSSDELNSEESDWVGQDIARMFEESNEIESTSNKTESKSKHPTAKQTHQANHTSSAKPKKTTEKAKPKCYKSSNATIMVTLHSLLVDRVTLRYNLGGNALIRIGESKTETLYNIDSTKNKNPVNFWVGETIPLDGSSTVYLAAFVYGEGDYILIDTLAVEKDDVTRSPTFSSTTENPTNSSTTSSPEPAPASGQSKSGNNTPFFILSAILYFSFKML